MPEGPEVDTDKLHEEIHEELEREGGALLRRIALTTALLAALAAITSLEAGSTVNEALVLKTESTRLQAQASDQWAYYQAKGIKAGIQEAARTSWLAMGKPAPAEYAERSAKYAAEQDSIRKKAEALEHERDAKSEEADHLMHRHHGYAGAVAMFQVAIALGAVAALTRVSIVWLGSVALGVVATVMSVWQMLGR